MGLSKEEKEERQKDEHVKYITERICNKDGKKPYVFISYKSDDWKVVLHDAVYRLVKEYGLNVYFDGDFDGHNPLWTTQFPENMESHLCKGVLVFLDDKYATSYATLLELMYSQVGCYDETQDYFIKKPVIPICLGDLTEIHDDTNTGLGIGVYEDGTKNVHSQTEKLLFDNQFNKLEKGKVFYKSSKKYKSEGKLSKELCSVMVEELLQTINVNDNDYRENGSLEAIVNSIKDACGEEVFGVPSVPPTLPNPPTPLTPRTSLWQYTPKGVVSRLQWDGSSKSCVVLKGSKVAAEAAGFAKLASAQRLKKELMEAHVIVNDEFVTDYECDKISTMINVLNGGSVSMPKEISTEKLRLISGDSDGKQGIGELLM